MNRPSISIRFLAALLFLVAIPSTTQAQISVRSQLSHDQTVEPGESKEIPFLFRLLPAGGTAVDMGNEVDIRWQYLLDNDLHLLETKLIRKAG